MSPPDTFKATCDQRLAKAAVDLLSRVKPMLFFLVGLVLGAHGRRSQDSGTAAVATAVVASGRDERLPNGQRAGGGRRGGVRCADVPLVGSRRWGPDARK